MLRIVLVLSAVLASFVSFAEIKLPALVGDNMVLQREKPIRIWGYGSPNEKVTVDFNRKSYTTTTGADGKWALEFSKMKAGGPYTMTLKGTNEITLRNILIGDVWLLSGQSNMEMSVRESLNPKQEMAAAVYPDIRLFTINKHIALTPKSDTQGKWEECSPETVGDFSAVGYFFARDLRKKGITVPMGLIDASWGGTLAETWVSPEALLTLPEFKETALKTAKFDIQNYNEQQKAKHEKWLGDFDKNDIGIVNGNAVWATEPLNPEWKPIQLPGNFEFKKIDELFNFDGIVWFRKDIQLDEVQDMEIFMGHIMNSDITYINGHKVGAITDAWGKNRQYKIAAGVLKKGTNTIAVKVSNYGGDGGFRFEPEEFYLKGTNGKTIHLSGEWKYRISHRITHYDRPEKELGPNTLTSVLSNGMIAPVSPLSIKGVLWYQGEANWAKTELYARIFQTLISDWRERFRDSKLPFLYVQLAGYQKKRSVPSENSWSELREAQAKALKLPYTAMVTAMDIGDEADIHPKNKQEVGRRLSLEALRLVYGQKKTDERSPYFKKVEWKDNAAFISFDAVSQGLKTKEGELKGFEISEDGKTFKWAKAELIDKKTVKVFLPEIATPAAVRYAWEENPEDANLVNNYNLPALPFRVNRQ